MKKLVATILVLCLTITTFGILTLPASAAAWHANFSQSGSVFIKGEEVTLLAPTAANQTNFYIPGSKANGWIKSGGTFDVEWTIKLDTFHGSKSTQVRANTHRIMLGIYEDRVSCPTAEGPFEASYPIGNEYHTYRAIAKDAQCELYIDGELVGEFGLEKGSFANEFIAWNMGADAGPAQWTLKNVTIYNPDAVETSDEEEKEELELDEDNFPYEPKIVTEEWYNDFEDGSFGGLKPKPGWEIKDGMLCGYQAGYAAESGAGYPSISMPINLGYGRDFVYESKFRVNNFGTQCGMQVGYPGYRAHCGFKNNRLQIGGNDSPFGEMQSEGITLDDKEWHTLKIATSHGGSKQIYYLDGVPVLSCDSYPHTRADGYIYIYVNAAEGPEEWCGMDIEYIKLTTTRYDLKMDLPRAGAEYLENSEIDFTSHLKRTVKPEDAPSIDYVINGQVVATGQAPDYKASVSNLPAGNYEVTAVCGDYKSTPAPFTVRPRVKGELLAELDNNGELFASLNVFNESDTDLDEVVYLLDGNLVGSSTTAPYRLSISDVALTSHSLLAICRDKNGVVLEKFSKRLLPEVPEEKASTNYASEISYTITGDGGTAEVDVRNGNHRLYLKHSKDTLYYLTDTGEETAAAGLGDYRIITDGPFAEIYHNGQMVASMYMPRCGKNERNIAENGLMVENYKAVIPEERQNYLVKRDVKDQEKIYSLDNLPFYHNLDFVANKNDEFRLSVNDIYFQGDITLRDGKFYAWTTKNDTTPTHEMEIADAVDTEEDVYYRLETAGGMCRLYGNGRWLGSFRAVHAIGEPSLAINVKKGELPYVAVSDNADIYYFHEDFEGNGRVAAEDYWWIEGMNYLMDENIGAMALLGDSDIGYARLMAYPGDVDLSAKLEVKKQGDGIWLFANNDVNTYHTRAGYNFETGEYEIVDWEYNSNSEELTDKVTKKGAFPEGETVDMAIKVEKSNTAKKVSLYVNGEFILSKDNCLIQHGKVGVALKNSTVYVEEIDYRGDARVLAGAAHYLYNGSAAETLSQAGYIDLPGGGVRAFTRWNSPFELTKDGKDWVRNVEITQVEGMSGHLVQHPDGELVSVLKAEHAADEIGLPTYAFDSYISTDLGETWKKQGMVQAAPAAGVSAMPGRLTIGPSGRIYLACGISQNEDFGHAMIYYSDDKGYTWKKSKDEMNARVEGYGIQEVQVMEFEKVTRAYFRNDMGIIHYYNSYDRGETWDLTPHRTPFFDALNCFGFTKDPEDPNTLYLGWSNDNAGLHARNQYNRSNWSLARSTDAGETWEMIGTFHESNNPYLGFTMMNLVAYATKDYIVMDAMAGDDHKTYNQGRTIMINKDKNVPSKRLQQLHFISERQLKDLSYDKVKQKENMLAVNTKRGDVLLRGTRMEGVANGDAVLVDIAANYIGAKASTAENGDLIFNTGDAAVTIPASALTQKDGKTYVKLSALAEKFQMYVAEKGNVIILSPYSGWGVEQMKAIVSTVDPFTQDK